LIWLEKISKAIVDGGVRSFDTQALNIWSRGRGPLKRSSAIRTWRPEFFLIIAHRSTPVLMQAAKPSGADSSGETAYPGLRPRTLPVAGETWHHPSR